MVFTRKTVPKIESKTHQLLPSTEIFSKRRKIYPRVEGKPELVEKGSFLSSYSDGLEGAILAFYFSILKIVCNQA